MIIGLRTYFVLIDSKHFFHTPALEGKAGEGEREREGERGRERVRERERITNLQCVITHIPLSLLPYQGY